MAQAGSSHSDVSAGEWEFRVGCKRAALRDVEGCPKFNYLSLIAGQWVRMWAPISGKRPFWFEVNLSLWQGVEPLAEERQNEARKNQQGGPKRNEHVGLR